MKKGIAYIIIEDSDLTININELVEVKYDLVFYKDKHGDKVRYINNSRNVYIGINDYINYVNNQNAKDALKIKDIEKEIADIKDDFIPHNDYDDSLLNEKMNIMINTMKNCIEEIQSINEIKDILSKGTSIRNKIISLKEVEKSIRRDIGLYGNFNKKIETKLCHIHDLENRIKIRKLNKLNLVNIKSTNVTQEELTTQNKDFEYTQPSKEPNWVKELNELL